MSYKLVQKWQMYWPEAKDFIERAVKLSQKKYTIDDVYRFLKEGVFQLWVSDTAAAITELVT